MKKIVFSLLITCSGYSYSACIQNPGFNNIQAFVPARTFTVQYDDTSVRDLGSINITYLSAASTTTYSASNGECGNAYLNGTFVNNWSPNASNIAPSNISGVGITVATGGIGGNFNRRFGPPSAGTLGWVIYDTKWHITFKKTGQITSSNYIRSGMIARLTQTNATPSSTWYLTALNMPANTVRINVLSCSLKNSQSVYNVELGDWYDTQFENIGDTSTSVDIPITLTCMAGANIKATVTSSAGYVDINTGKLALSGADKATGVAIQLLDKNSAPIKLNTKNSLQNNVPAGDYMFNWKARYIKTADKITPGSANTTATVNIRYE
ncbi:fimbrial protein [Providencia alcalifaciens]|uniref:fimbrial protein n=1 Tax=Providencia alcalifaciens TaxID=126385 RepID=UPI002B05A279|nr:fimbrial protein [Providencia alcalifaciens]